MLDDERLNLLKKEYSIYAFVYQLVWTFRELFKMKEDALKRLTEWLTLYRSKNVHTELDSFINGIELDLDAVKAAIERPYYTSLIEGCNNKIKSIKRQSYGRESFQFLRAKILQTEVWRRSST